MNQWLYQRLTSHYGQGWRPDFALQNSARWPVSLRILCETGQFEDENLRSFYSKTQRRAKNEAADNVVFEALLMAFHNLAAVNRIKMTQEGYSDLIRSATVAWYYGVYYGATAMVGAADGSRQENHTATAKAWGRQVLEPGFVVQPFSFYTTTLVKTGYEKEILALKNGNRFSLNDEPVDYDTAFGGAISYLNGTAKRDRELFEDKIKAHRDFKKLCVDSFRSKEARKFRDEQLSGRRTNFIHQAIRYRGKANYRDSIYLSYGQPRPTWISNMVAGYSFVLSCFLKMVCHYCERRVEKGVWDVFAEDVLGNTQFEMEESLVKWV